MASSKKLATTISSSASFIYFLVIFLQFPLFRVPCRTGICKTPLEVTCSQLIATKLIPEALVKALLYPGAISTSLFTNKAFPNYNNFLNSHTLASQNLAHVDFHDLQFLEVIAGSYMSVVGAFMGLIKPGRMSLFGTLLVLWGLSREVILRKSAYLYLEEDVCVKPAMSIALISAFLSVRKDIRKIYRSCKSRFVVKQKFE